MGRPTRTRKIIGFTIILIVIIPYGISKVTKSNASFTKYNLMEQRDAGDTIAIRELNKLVKRNFLDRDYYEAAAFTDISIRWYANYNKKHQALLITGDPHSGWSYFYYCTPSQLEMIAERRISSDSLRFYLKPFPTSLLIECPTRSRDLFRFF